MTEQEVRRIVRQEIRRHEAARQAETDAADRRNLADDEKPAMKEAARANPLAQMFTTKDLQ